MKKQEFKNKTKKKWGEPEVESGTTSNIPTSESQGCPKEKRNNKKWKTYLNK